MVGFCIYVLLELNKKGKLEKLGGQSPDMMSHVWITYYVPSTILDMETYHIPSFRELSFYQRRLTVNDNPTR